MKIKFENLPLLEQNVLTQIYGSQSGYTTHKIAYVEELSDWEQTFFDRGNLVSPNFFVQRLYKVSGNIVPLKFNLVVSRLLEVTDALRTNYCATDSRTLKIVFESRKELPEILYRNLVNVPDIDATLKNIMEADMRATFDLRHDKLVRFAVFHTGDAEYAVLITMPKLVEECFDVKNFFNAVADLEALRAQEKFVLPIITPEPIKKYWAQILQDLPEVPKVPLAQERNRLYKQKSYKLSIAGSLMSDLEEKAQSNKLMLMAIYQAAWTYLLQQHNKTTDITYTTLLPDKVTEDINTIPLRIKVEGTVQEVVNAHFKQILISQPYAGKNFFAIKEILKSQNKNFDHFLSFGDFMKEAEQYSTAKATFSGTCILQSSWNAQNTKLGIYFKYKDDATSITILYDENKFIEDFGKLISRKFQLTLQQMNLDWNTDSSTFLERLQSRFTAEQQETVHLASYLQNFISQLPILQVEEVGTVQQLMPIAKVETYFEGDRLDGALIEQNFIFVSEGKLVRSLRSGDGWYNTLDIVKENSWLNETVLLENRKAKMSAEILTDSAVIMLIPLDAMQKFLRDNPSIAKKFLQHILAEMEKYQRLWIQA